jgi:predicted HAD superfamily phosphohydrolase YqeG
VSWLQPDFYYSSLFAVDLGMLERRGIEGLVIDLDNTILPRDTNELEQRAHDWVAEATGLFAVMIVSNNTHAYPKDIAARNARGIGLSALVTMGSPSCAAMSFG